MRFTSLFVPLAHLARLAFAASSANPDDPTGTILYVTAPACGSFRCVVEWRQGETVLVNWINPPQGDVSVQLVSNLAGGATYNIVNSIPATSQAGYCDAGSGVGVVIPGVSCGAVEFAVPAGWTIAENYTIAVTSLSDSSTVGYTDAISILATNSSFPSPPSGTSASLLTIPAPTSTNVGASVANTQSLPKPTAVTGAQASSAARASDASSGKPLATVTAAQATNSAASVMAGGAATTSTSTSASAASSSKPATAAASSLASRDLGLLAAALVGALCAFIL